MKWIDVLDAKPPFDTDVLCWSLDFEVRVGRVTKDGDWHIDNYPKSVGIDYWMELPSSPR